MVIGYNIWVNHNYIIVNMFAPCQRRTISSSVATSDPLVLKLTRDYSLSWPILYFRSFFLTIYHGLLHIGIVTNLMIRVSQRISDRQEKCLKKSLLIFPSHPPPPINIIHIYMYLEQMPSIMTYKASVKNAWI